MLTLDEVRKLRLGSQVFHLIERDEDGQPAPFRVVGFALHSGLPGGVPAPYLVGPDGETFVLTRLAMDELAPSRSGAIEQSSRLRKLLAGAEGVLEMVYDIRLLDGRGRVVDERQGVSESQAEALYQDLLRVDPQASLVKVPRYKVAGREE